jgi:Protein of unknown function (DUF3467)
MSDDTNKVTNLSPIPLDPVYASSVAVQGTNEEFVLIFSRNRPALAEIDGKPQHVVVGEPVSVVILSVHTLKDLNEILSDTVKRHEAEFGVIETAFTRSRGEAKGRG